MPGPQRSPRRRRQRQDPGLPRRRRQDADPRGALRRHGRGHGRLRRAGRSGGQRRARTRGRARARRARPRRRADRRGGRRRASAATPGCCATAAPPMRSSGAWAWRAGTLDGRIAGGRVPPPAQRYRHGGLAANGRRSATAGTLRARSLGLSSQDVAGSRTDASTGRRTYYVQRTVEGSLSLIDGGAGATGAALTRERYAVTYDAAGRPVDLMVIATGIYRGLVRPAHPPAAGRPGCCRRRRAGCARTSRRRTSTSPTPRACAWRGAFLRAGPPSGRGPLGRRGRDRRRPAPAPGRPSASSTPAPTTPTSGATASTARWASRGCNSAASLSRTRSTPTSWPPPRAGWTGCGACAGIAWARA